MSPTTKQIAAAVKRDLRPRSADHWARVGMGGVAVGAAVFKYVMHQGTWQREELYFAALFLLGGFGVIFTGSVVALFRSVPVPWRNNGNGNPPPAEG